MNHAVVSFMSCSIVRDGVDNPDSSNSLPLKGDDEWQLNTTTSKSLRKMCNVKCQTQNVKCRSRLLIFLENKKGSHHHPYHSCIKEQ